jgi:20S proteasome alpha/beta subunit
MSLARLPLLQRAPVTFAHFVSSTLYERRFGPYLLEIVVVGLDPI